MRWLLFPSSLAALAVALSLSGGAEKKPDAPARFGLAVREDIFAGMGGDEKAMKRGLKKCDDALAKSPKNAEALVWRGAGRTFQAGQLFRKNEVTEGVALWTKAQKDMDDAVKLAPKSPGVRIPRAVVLLPAAHNVPEAMRKPLLKKVVDDLQTTYELQKADFHKLGTHPRGELRMALADAYRLAGDLKKSKEQLRAVLKELPGSAYAARAKKWLEAKPTAKLAHACVGCHRKAGNDTDDFKANIWQGDFPHHNTRADGWDRTAPFKSFPPTATACTTWRATCGSGAPTGNGPTPTPAAPG